MESNAATSLAVIARRIPSIRCGSEKLSSIIQKRNYLNIRRNKPLNIIHAEGVNFPIIFV